MRLQPPYDYAPNCFDRFLLDFDDVLGKLSAAMLSELKRRFGTNIFEHELFTYHWWETSDQTRQVWNDCLYDRSWTITNVKPALDARSFVQGLRELYVSPVIVSFREPHMAEWLHTWMNLFLTPGNPPAVVCSGDKALVAEKLQLNFAVEDSPYQATALANAPIMKQVYLLNKPYNMDVENHPKIKRVNSFQDIYDDYFVHWFNRQMAA